jgi:putative phage-type endonuclease
VNYPEQGSGEWLNQRVGMLTASRMAEAMATLKPDKNGIAKPAKARRKLLMEKLAEKLTGNAAQNYLNAAMQHGNLYEPAGKSAFEERYGELLQACGFIPHPTIKGFGASPDALLGADAVFELKCPTSPTHAAWLSDGIMPAQHKPQVLAQLACTKRSRAVFASFDPRMKPKEQLFVVRWTPEPAEIYAVEVAAVQFIAELDAAFCRLPKGNDGI